MNIFEIVLGAVFKFWFIFPLIALSFIFRSRWFKGWVGELLVNRLLASLPQNDYFIIRDVTIPTEDGTTQIDHIVVSKYGVFVLETKNMKGWIYGSAKQRQWTQKIYRHTSKFQNPLHQNYKHTKVLEAALGLTSKQFNSVIVFIGDSIFKTEMPENVTYAQGCLRYIQTFTDIVIDEAQLDELVKTIETIKLDRGLATNLSHKKHVKELVKGKKLENICPKCGSPMILRESKKGNNIGNKFWGCTSFPKCKTAINPTDL